MVVCSVCGHENPEGARFCNGCGRSLTAVSEATEERKIVSVVFVDLVGSTARAERLDPEDVRAQLASYHARARTELERRGGTVEKFIGDAVVAVFGAPMVHEDDAERAVRAAIAIRDTVARPDVSLRIAVNTGEALVSLGARPAEGEGMVAGDVVNTAARLQSAAPVDGILVGEGTYRATSHVIEYRAVEPIVVKGKDEPVPAWEVVAARARFGADVDQAPLAPLVGREQEVDQLRDALARVRRERVPELVTLVGVPGMGKSRLVAELFQVVDAEPELITWRQGRCLPYGEGISYWALGEMAKAQAGVLESDSADEAEAEARRGCRCARPGRRGGRLGCGPPATARRPRAGSPGREPRRAARRSRPGGASSRRSPSSARRCSSSRISTGPTTGCSTSSTGSSTGPPGCRCSSSAVPDLSC